MIRRLVVRRALHAADNRLELSLELPRVLLVPCGGSDGCGDLEGSFGAALLESSLSAEAIARVSGAGFYAHGYRRQIDQCCPSDVLRQSRVAQYFQKIVRRGGDAG